MQRKKNPQTLVIFSQNHEIDFFFLLYHNLSLQQKSGRKEGKNTKIYATLQGWTKDIDTDFFRNCPP